MIFRGDMVRAILAWRKTQTRREHKTLRYKPGEVVYVKEAWRTNDDPLDDGLNYDSVWYRADSLEHERRTEPWKSPLFMPQWASRCKLEITAARFDQLHAMTEADALAEGVEPSPVQTPLEAFAELWDDIKGDGAWEKNPTVCVYRFEVAG